MTRSTLSQESHSALKVDLKTQTPNPIYVRQHPNGTPDNKNIEDTQPLVKREPESLSLERPKHPPDTPHAADTLAHK
jgi:hypothetical protein